MDPEFLSILMQHKIDFKNKKANSRHRFETCRSAFVRVHFIIEHYLHRIFGYSPGGAKSLAKV